MKALVVRHSRVKTRAGGDRDGQNLCQGRARVDTGARSREAEQETQPGQTGVLIEESVSGQGKDRVENGPGPKPN